MPAHLLGMPPIVQALHDLIHDEVLHFRGHVHRRYDDFIGGFLARVGTVPALASHPHTLSIASVGATSNHDAFGFAFI